MQPTAEEIVLEPKQKGFRLLKYHLTRVGGAPMIAQHNSEGKHPQQIYRPPA